MKIFKRLFLLTMTFSLLFHSVSFANVRHLSPDEFDPRTMTLEDRMNWVDENIEPVYSGPAESLLRGEWLYTTTGVSYVESSVLYRVGTLKTRMRFMCDDNFVNVISWDNLLFEAIPVAPSIINYNTDFEIANNTPHNQRVIYTVWFNDLSGAYFIEHRYTMHGHGAYDLDIYSGGPY